MSVERSCLLVIDAQNGFFSARTAETLLRLEGLLRARLFQHVVCTRFVNQENSPFERLLGWTGLRDPESCALRADAERAAELVIEKHGYSGVSIELLSFLRERNIGRVFLAGVDTDCCVLTTAVALFEHGLEPLVLAEYCASNGNQNAHDAALLVLSRLIGSSRVIRGNADAGWL